MAEEKDQGSKTLHASGTKTLSLKRDTGVVRQNFSHGRSKQVVVEKKRTRALPGARPAGDKPQKQDVAPAKSAAHQAAAEAFQPKPAAGAPKAGMVLRSLSEAEKEARAKAVDKARILEEEARKRAEEEARRRSDEDARLKREREASAKRKSEEEARKASEEQAKRRAEQEAHRRLDAETKPAPGARPALADDEEETSARRGKGPAKAPRASARAAPRRGGGKITVTKALGGEDERQRSVASFRRHVAREQRRAQAQEQAPVAPREIVIPEALTVGELGNRMARRGVDVIKVLMKNGVMATINDVIDGDMAQIVAEELGHTVKRVAESDVLAGLRGREDEAGKLAPRAPVVTVMGHVDHGKTSLLDALRATDVAAGEAGGITQHIGAYQVKLSNGARITFLDTPGHAAFTAMRARGAKVTDIVILVVAADDGVMPQTVEAIAHARAAKVPIIVAINKMDKPDANPSRVKTDLLQHDVVVEDMGGDTQVVEVSAAKKQGLDKLEEAILLQAEILDLKANPARPGDGAVIEAKLDKGRGPVATLLVQRGTLKIGDILVAGSEWGRVRALINERGEQLQSAGPSMPVEVLGLTGVPEAGDEFVVVDSEMRAREVTDYRARKRREARAATVSRATLDQFVSRQKQGEKKTLPVVVKGDVQGSIEAIASALNALGTGEVGVQVLQSGVGGITESDVILAHASGALIVAFNVRAHAEARERAKRDGVEIRYYNVIYNIIDDIKAALSGMLAPALRETFLGNAEILEIFAISKVGKVAGCRVTEGVVRRGARVRLIRDKIVIHEGKLSTLKRFKDEVREVVMGQECGMAFENYQDMQKGDVIECYEVEEIQRKL